MDDPIRGQSELSGEDSVPEALRRDLSRLHVPGAPIEVPREVDERLMQMAQWRFAERVAEAAGSERGLSWAHPRRRMRVFPVRLVTMTAAAAALLLAVLLAPRAMSPRGVPGPVVAVRGDIDADGRVDIVDALLLAKHAAGGGTGGEAKSWDVNGDGVVDQGDALAIREMVVRLEGGA